MKLQCIRRLRENDFYKFTSCRNYGGVALAIVSSEIAVTLMDRVKTAHTVIKLPLDIPSFKTLTCNKSKTNGLAQGLKKCKLILWE